MKSVTKYACTVLLCGMAMSGGAYAMKPWKISIGGIVDVAFHQPIVSQRGKTFSPTEVTMPLGATIRIDNDDNIVHNLRIFSPDGEKHDYGIQKPGESTDIDLKQLGEYMARCNIHPIMKLVIHVK